MGRLLREPLVHFLLGGAALFLLYGQVPAGGDERPDRIVVTEGQIAGLAATFERTWMRAPTRAELEGLIDDFVTEEILYREALALGFDRNDLVVRRRMRQKMEFLHDGLADAREPSEDELHAFLRAEADRFRLPERVSFEQLFLDPGRPGPAVEERAAAVVERLRREPGLRAGEDGLGDPTLLPPALRAATPDQVAGAFGTDFAEALAAAPEGSWTGPIPSSFGVHLVRVTAREAGRVPTLEEVRSSVEREWAAQQRETARNRFYQEMRERYKVEVRIPAEPAGAALASRRR